LSNKPLCKMSRIIKEVEYLFCLSIMRSNYQEQFMANYGINYLLRQVNFEGLF